jgi:glucan phosphoethanolaminetransferase (alkaline phosphatase superfamily)
VEIAHNSRLANQVLVIAVYALAMAYLESAVVVYLQRALSMSPATLFPLRDQATLGALGSIEVGREVATIFMLVAIGWLAGRTSLERLAWTCVAFGIWDIGYYFWLWVFIDWPSSLATTDLLVLIPVPWVAPVLAPVLVSLALIFFGLLVASRIRGGESFIPKLKHWLLLIAGGLVVILSFTLDSGNIRSGGMPTSFAWPVFAAGMGIAVLGVASALRR